MPPVKPTNPLTRLTRAITRKNKYQLSTQLQKLITKQIKPQKNNMSIKNKNKDTNTDTTIQQNQQTITTGPSNRNNTIDTKTTIRKKSFQFKPIMKELNKRIINLNKQYTPQYFTEILQYMIEKQTKSTMSPTARKIANWRYFINEKLRIEQQIKKEVLKIKNVINRNRISFGQESKKTSHEIYRSKFYINQHLNPQWRSQNNLPTINDSISNFSQPISQSERLNTMSYLPDRIAEISNDSSEQNSSIPSHNSQPLLKMRENYPSWVRYRQQITEQEIETSWNTKFDKFVCLIDTMYQLLGQNQCINSIFPACYIFYSLVVSDIRVFHYLDTQYRTNHHQYPNTQFHHPSQQYQSYNEPSHQFIQPSTDLFYHSTINQLIEYYVIVSLLIATKYHDIYPVSAIDLIQCINRQLSMEKVVKIESEVLEMFDFCCFFNDNQIKFINMFIVVVGWTTHQKNICQFILQSGLNNPKLYRYSPLHKAAVAIAFYQQKFLKTQQKFMMIKNLCPGLTFDVINQIKKEYLQILLYNHSNQFVAQKKKFYIFDKQIKSLTRKSIG